MPPRPDWLVWPVLFLLHHFIELELKEVITLSGSIGTQLGVKVAQSTEGHNLPKLLAVVDSNLTRLAPEVGVRDLGESLFLSISSRELIEDLQEFGGGGEYFRYPVKRSREGGGPTLPDTYVADIPKVM